ncbi:MAG: anti-sigma factor [Rhodospirillales bacterium]|nr:anti-sigma factor [Rhodospirillales bacterium]
MTEPDKLDDMQLHAYVDGELDDEARTAVEAWLADHAEDASRVRAYQAQSEALHDLYDDVLNEPLPPSLHAALAEPSTGSTFAPAPWKRIAAGLVIFFMGGFGGWFANDYGKAGNQSRGAFVEQAVGAHAVYVSEVRHPVEVGADQEAHLMKWLTNRLGHTVKAPNMADAGFSLVGGRLLPDGGQPAAQFMYEDKQGRRVTLYVRVEAGADTSFRSLEKGKMSAFYWVDSPLAYALIGNVPKDVLLGLARMAYEAL